MKNVNNVLIEKKEQIAKGAELLIQKTIRVQNKMKRI